MGIETIGQKIDKIKKLKRLYLMIETLPLQGFSHKGQLKHANN